MKVRDLLTDESKWTQRVYGRTADGRDWFTGAPETVSWCLLGAIMRVYDEPERQRIATRVYQTLGGPPHQWNDAPERTFADVKRLVDELDI